MTASDKIRVMLVDDHAVVRRGLSTFFLTSDDLQLVGEATGGEEAVQLCESLQPDVVLMDLVMPGMDGVEATRAIRARWSHIRVIALTSFETDELVQGALQAGAISYLLKNVSALELAEAIRAAHAGRSTLAPEATKVLVRTAGQPKPPGHDLTAREREVLALLVQGLSNDEIAERLALTHSTVKFHVSNILSKLGASSRAHAVALAVQHNMVT
jgi:NarL family two-component system response regulator LiaR